MSHALLSPSSASRWLACTPSARLEADFPDTAGRAADEGTLAHKIGETLIRAHLATAAGDLPRSRKEWGLFNSLLKDPLYAPEMRGFCESYRDFVIEAYNEALAADPHAVIFIEQKLDLTSYVPEGFGTGDCVIIGNGVLRIIDLKYGKGVLVDATENRQMMSYGLGALLEFDFLYDIETVQMTIFQPRIDNFSDYELPASELLRWAEEELKPGAQRAWAGEGEQVAGSWCRFCKVKAQCRALAEHHLELAKHEFRKPELMSPEEIAEVMVKSEGLTGWVDTVKKHALIEALKGVLFPGFKVVEGRSTRKYADEKEVAANVLKMGWPESDVYAKELVGITKLESLIGKAGIAQLGELIIKPAGAPTLVPESDKRAEFKPAAADFSIIKDDDFE